MKPAMIEKNVKTEHLPKPLVTGFVNSGTDTPHAAPEAYFPQRPRNERKLHLTDDQKAGIERSRLNRPLFL